MPRPMAAARDSEESVVLKPAESTPISLLILVELKGGNDGLNTLVPFGDPAYCRLRPRLALAADDVLRLAGRDGDG